MALKITIDPGHGQYGNKSPNNTAYIEGTQMWKLGQRLKTALEAYGFQVFFTRPNISDDPSLDARGKIAGKNGCAMFLSLHSNAPGKNADGTYSKTCTGSVVYYSMTRPENKSLADQLGKKVSELMGHYYRGSMTREYPNRPGVDYYGVIRGAAQSGCKCAFIIEHGFHTNIQDSNWLLSEENLQKLADAEAKIIADYFGVVKIGNENRPVATPSNGSVEVGDVVKIIGSNYYSDKAIPGWVKAKNWIVRSVNGSRVVIDKSEDGTNAICSPINAADLAVVKKANGSVSAALALGDKVKMASGAPLYGQTRKFQSWVYNATLYVRGINGDRIVVSTLQSGAVTGAVDKKYLTKI